jgi:hypothetical protein
MDRLLCFDTFLYTVRMLSFDDGAAVLLAVCKWPPRWRRALNRMREELEVILWVSPPTTVFQENWMQCTLTTRQRVGDFWIDNTFITHMFHPVADQVPRPGTRVDSFRHSIGVFVPQVPKSQRRRPVIDNDDAALRRTVEKYTKRREEKEAKRRDRLNKERATRKQAGFVVCERAV